MNTSMLKLKHLKDAYYTRKYSHYFMKNQIWRETNSLMNYSLSHQLMIFIGELWKKIIHDHMHGDSIIKDLGWFKNFSSLFKIWFGKIEIKQSNFYFEERFLMSLIEHYGHTKKKEVPHGNKYISHVSPKVCWRQKKF